MEFDDTLSKYKGIIKSHLNTLLDEKIHNSKGFMKTSYVYLKEFILRGGKRVRPILTIMAYKAVRDRDEEKIYLPAVGIELFHNSSLIHDDVMDEDSERRGMLSMHKYFEQLYLEDHEEIEYKGGIFNEMSKRFGVSMAILQGNILYALTERCLANSQFESDKVRKALDIINETYGVINEGQMLDILSESNIEMTDEDYLSMIKAKTAHLFKTSVQIGAILGDAERNQLELLNHYALNLGIAFQLHDDLIDISSRQKGQTLSSDIRKGKFVLLIKKALEKSSEKQKDVLCEAWGNEEADQRMIQAAIDVLHNSGAVNYVKQIAEDKILLAKSFLKTADFHEDAKNFFALFADYVAERAL